MKNTSLSTANQALKEKKYELALSLYAEALKVHPEFKDLVAINIKIAERGLGSREKPLNLTTKNIKEKVFFKIIIFQ